MRGTSREADLNHFSYVSQASRLLAVVAAGVILLACGDGGVREIARPTATAQTVTPQTVTPQTEGPRILIMPLGRTARTDSAEMTIHGVRRSRNEAGMQPPEGREWLLVDATLLNTASGDIELQMRFLDRDDLELERANPPGADGFDKPVAAGAEVRGEVAFLAPVGMVGGTIIYGPGEERWAIQMGMFPIDP